MVLYVWLWKWSKEASAKEWNCCLETEKKMNKWIIYLILSQQNWFFNSWLLELYNNEFVIYVIKLYLKFE